MNIIDKLYNQRWGNCDYAQDEATRGKEYKRGLQDMYFEMSERIRFFQAYEMMPAQLLTDWHNFKQYEKEWNDSEGVFDYDIYNEWLVRYCLGDDFVNGE